MQKIKNLVIFSLTGPLLMGCFEKTSYSYLMQHPSVLTRKIEDCQSTDEKTKADIKECEIVLYAASNMATLVAEQRENPEKFGQRILDLEMANANTKEQLQAANQQVKTLQEKKDSSAELQLAKQSQEKLKQTFHDQREEIKVLLAVVGINSPE